jgi:hypothetical protein
MSLAIEVQSVDLRFVGFDGHTTEGSLFLHLAGERSARPQTALDRLNDPAVRFVPVRVDEHVELVNLAWLAFVSRPGRAPEVAAQEEIGALRASVSLDLAGGMTVEGDLHYLLPSGHSRVSDLLNSADERFLLVTTADETLYVHRAAVVRARTS